MRVRAGVHLFNRVAYWGSSQSRASLVGGVKEQYSSHGGRNATRLTMLMA